MQEMVDIYQVKFGLDQPLWKQYLNYFNDILHLDFNYSISNYPKTVTELILEALPWTIGLLSVTTIFSFRDRHAAGSVPGLAARPEMAALPDAADPGAALAAVLPARPDPDVPLAFYTAVAADVRRVHARDVPCIFACRSRWTSCHHSILPALSIILVSIGGWALGMRAMMITTQGEDYTNFAEAKGLLGRTIFLRYAMRNALLPQITALALALGHIVSGAMLVEVIFAFPGHRHGALPRHPRVRLLPDSGHRLHA